MKKNAKYYSCYSCQSKFFDAKGIKYKCSICKKMICGDCVREWKHKDYCIDCFCNKLIEPFNLFLYKLFKKTEEICIELNKEYDTDKRNKENYTGVHNDIKEDINRDTVKNNVV